MTVQNKNDIFLEAMVRGLLTNKITPVLCINRIVRLNLTQEEEETIMNNLDIKLRVKNVTIADILKRAYKEDIERRRQLS